MTPISASEMSSIRASANSLLSLPAVIQRKTMTSDTMGQETEVWATVSSPGLLVGMRQPGPAELSNYDFLVGSLSAWQVHFPNGTDVRHQDRLLISGLTMVVQVILQPRSYSAYADVLASEVR